MESCSSWELRWGRCVGIKNFGKNNTSVNHHTITPLLIFDNQLPPTFNYINSIKMDIFPNYPAIYFCFNATRFRMSVDSAVALLEGIDGVEVSTMGDDVEAIADTPEQRRTVELNLALVGVEVTWSTTSDTLPF